MRFRGFAAAAPLKDADLDRDVSAIRCGTLPRLRSRGSIEGTMSATASSWTSAVWLPRLRSRGSIEGG